MIQETAVQVIDVAKGPLACYLYKASCLFFLRMHYNQNDFSVYHFTACPYGYFGHDCADKCNDSCTGCNILNGLCDSGCHPGWKGEYCHLGKYSYIY